MRKVCSFLTLCVLLTVLGSDLSAIALGTVRRASPIFFRLVDLRLVAKRHSLFDPSPPLMSVLGHGLDIDQNPNRYQGCRSVRMNQGEAALF
jgi:hypothetical protein